MTALDRPNRQEKRSVEQIAQQFVRQGKITQVKPFGSGNINDTFLVLLDDAPEPYFILQRINTQVFSNPRGVMQNMRIFSEHVRDRLHRQPPSRRWEVPRVLLTQNDGDHCTDCEDFWRAISFVDNSHTHDTIRDSRHAEEIGYGLGMFHSLVSDLPMENLVDTLEGFHITPRYLEQYDAALSLTCAERTAEVEQCLTFVEARREIAQVLEIAKAEGKLPIRLMHGDPKINNVMVDRETGQAVSLIDLDTVKPGLVHYDIGDCLRSGCNPLGEETEDFEAVQFSPDLAEAMLKGYLFVAREFLTENDYYYLYDAIRLITFELGLRFFTDHLAGNIYFKAKHPRHNLNRARVQFKLVESIEAQETTLKQLIESLR